MKNYEIKNATAIYTGGGIYIYYGQLENGNYFRACDGWEYISICDSDTSVEDADYSEFYEEHEINGLYNDDYIEFWNEMLCLIMAYSENGYMQVTDLERRMVIILEEPETKTEPTTHDRIVALEREILRLKRIEELEAFKDHMNNTIEVLMMNGCTKESADKFHDMTFTISFNDKTIEIYNSHDAFQDIEYLIQREIDELQE